MGKYRRKFISMIVFVFLMVFSSSMLVRATTFVKFVAPKVAVSILSDTSLKLTFEKAKNIKGFIVYKSQYKSRGFNKINQGTSNTYTIKDMKKGTYYYRVRSYVIEGGTEKYSEYSDTITVEVNAKGKILSFDDGISGFEFTLYDKITEKDYSVAIVGHLIFAFNGTKTKIFGPKGNLIKEYQGDAPYTPLRSDLYAKSQMDDEDYTERWLNGKGEVDFSRDGYSDFIWVRGSFINIKTGAMSIRDDFEDIHSHSWFVYNPSFIDGITTVRVDNKYGLMNEEGKLVVEPMYDTGFVISGGYAIFQNSEGKWAYSDSMGRMSEFKFFSIRDGGQSGILIGEILKEYIYYSNDQGNILELSEKVVINQGKEYSVCKNHPTISVELGDFSDGLAHAVINYFYIDFKYELQSYTLFDGFIDTKGIPKINFTDYIMQNSDFMMDFGSEMGLDFVMKNVEKAINPFNLSFSTMPSANRDYSLFKYGHVVMDTKLYSVSLGGELLDKDELSKDFETGYAIYNKDGVQRLSFQREDLNFDKDDLDGIVSVEILESNCVATINKGNVLTIMDMSGKVKLTVENVSEIYTYNTLGNHPIIGICTKKIVDGFEKYYYGIYYDETGFYTKQYDALVEKTSLVNDDIIFQMKDTNKKFIVNKHKIIIPAEECFQMLYTGSGYVVVVNSYKTGSGYYNVTFYTETGKKIKTIHSLLFTVSDIPYGMYADRYTDHTVVLNNQYYNGKGTLLNDDKFFTEKALFNHGYTFARKFDQDNYALMSSDGTYLSGYIFTKENNISHNDSTPNKYGSTIIQLNGKVYRVQKKA